MEKIIQKAIEGRYKYDLPIRPTASPELLFIDPLFWKSLGKSCGWERYNALAPEMQLNGWKENALRFHEINLTQSWEEAVIWLEALVDNK